MNKTPLEQIKNELTAKEAFRKKYPKSSEEIKKVSWPSLFAGQDFNQALEKDTELQTRINIIDFEKTENDKELVEQEIKKIHNSSDNKQLINKKSYPIIWFKNIDKIPSGSALEKSLLPIFDSAQNYSLFNDEVDLNEFILIATSSTNDTGKLSNPLTSRLVCINAETAKPKEFFWDKYFYWMLIPSLLISIFFLGYFFWGGKKKEEEENKN